MTKKKKTGTREWAEHNINIATGCEHGCHYCYAAQMARRFKRVLTPKRWMKMEADPERWAKKYTKKEGVYMFPTAHDITPTILREALYTLKTLLSVGNKVLLVSKPHFECVQEICSKIRAWDAAREVNQRNLTFRFTIGAIDDKILRVWEPGAPDFEERRESLRHAYLTGFATSISIEPNLDPENVVDLIESIEGYVTGEIWIGKMNMIGQRVLPGSVPQKVIDKLKAAQTDGAVLAMVNEVSQPSEWFSQIRWKDSIKEVLRKHKT